MLKVPIDKATKSESTKTYLTPSPVASRHILSTNPNRKKGSDIKRRVIITESDGEEVEMIQFSEDDTKSSRSSETNSSSSRSSTEGDEFTVYQSSDASVYHRMMRQKAISAFAKAASLGHSHAKIELIKLTFFGFTEDEEMPAMTAVSLLSPDSTNATIFAEELERYADHPSFKDAKRAVGFISELPSKGN